MCTTYDILVTGHTVEEHLHNLEEVLKRLEEAGMRVKKDKCAFLLPKLSTSGMPSASKGYITSTAKWQQLSMLQHR